MSEIRFLFLCPSIDEELAVVRIKRWCDTNNWYRTNVYGNEEQSGFQIYISEKHG